MGKSFRQRVKKRKQDRAKHRRLPPPTISNKKMSVASEHHSTPSLLYEKIKRSPVLSRYLNPNSNVLIVGDGDFSFGRALVKLRSSYLHSAAPRQGSLTVTGYDSRAEAVRKYSKKKHNDSTEIEQALGIIQEQHDATVLHSIDATKLKEQLHDEQNNHPYDVVVFNFPHSGQQRVHINRNLMCEFFQSVRELFLDQQPVPTKQPRLIRQVHVTIKNQRPYIHWDIEKSAKDAGFVMNSVGKRNKVAFDMKLWNSLGYRHQTTVGPEQATSQPQLLHNGGEGSEAKLAQTWIFEFEQDQLKIDNCHHVLQKTNPKPEPIPTAPPKQQPKEKSKTEPTENEASTTMKTTKKNKDSRISKAFVQDLLQQRNRAREEKKWAEADRIRDMLQNDHGVALNEQKGGPTTWSFAKKQRQLADSDTSSLPKRKKAKHN